MTNVRSDRVRAVSNLSGRSARLRGNRFLVEGPQAVRELVRYATDDVLDLYLTAAAAERYADIADAADLAGVYVHQVSDEVSRAMSPDAQGILAVAERTRYSMASDVALGLLADVARDGALIAILSQVRDPGNAGAVIRACDAAGADAVVLTDSSVEITNPKVVRSTAGSMFHLPVLGGVDLIEAVDVVRAAGLQVLAADASGSTLAQFDGEGGRLARRTTWIFGNEAWGFTPDQLALVDEPVAVPIFGRAESLNLATAAAVCLYASALARRSAFGA
nr:RNA methyltransferase [Rarobacter faecitabidus]